MKIVAITSCATGIAHTYMAAEAIKKICKKKGFECKVEMQGALGIENMLKPNEIKEADLIIFANDVGITKEERFKEYKDKIIKVTPHSVIKDPSIIFNKKEENK
ncbi:MAG: PTS fructose transporter subunit IIB [Erysipelotrichaceae bacterium]|nr:PTS fructose transporter subunit IIB [Erysipelotrichaceae bacterium]